MIDTTRRSAYTPTSPTGPPPALAERLSRQETAVALMIADGFSDKQITDTLRISRNTLRIYIDRVRKKLGLRKDRNVRTEITCIVIRAWAEFDDEQCLTNSRQVGGDE